jgi:molybdopterin converting factor small subunit
MSIKIHLLPHLQHLSNGLNIVAVEGSTVGECLGHLIRQFPGMEKELFMARTVQDGDEIYIIHVLGGG